jgi:cytochrome P450
MYVCRKGYILVDNAQSTRVVPGLKHLPGLGNTFEYQRDRLGFITHLHRLYGDIASFHLLHIPVVILSHPRHVRYVLLENQRNFTIRETLTELLEITGDGLLTIDGELHRQQRRLVQPAFHKKRVETYADVMVRYTQEMLAQWQPGQHIEITQAMQELTMRIVAKCLFNIDLASQLADLSACFSTMIENPPRFHEYALHMRLNLPFTIYGRRQRSKARVDSVIYEMIAQRRAKERDEGDVLSMLLLSQEQNNQRDDRQIRDHIMTFFAAGHETTSNVMIWTFYLLSQHPLVLEKLQAELRTVLAGRAPTLHDCAHLHYTEWVLNEAMRLYPPVWTIGRRSIASFDMDGYHFPAGSFFMLSQWIIHRRSDLWEDADQFLPDRWHPERTQQILPCSYFPFGVGSRICIGMPFAQLETKLLLATILQRYIPRLLPGYCVVPQARITLRPRDGLPMVLEEVK